MDVFPLVPVIATIFLGCFGKIFLIIKETDNLTLLVVKIFASFLIIFLRSFLLHNIECCSCF